MEDAQDVAIVLEIVARVSANAQGLFSLASVSEEIIHIKQPTEV